MTQQPQKLNQSIATLHPATEVGTVTLKVADLKRSLTFYTELIGLRLFTQDGPTAALGTGDRYILKLEEVAGAKPQPVNTTGLYHAAILFPDRHSLAIKIAQIAAMQYPFGQSDHLVSEAFYLSDPDGNGLELYRDRPREEWKWVDNQVKMAIDPINFDDFFSEIKEGDVKLPDPSAPDGTKLGHMHLRVANIAVAEKFYHDVLGFDITAKMPGALFLSAGGYHHHLGMNTWESRGGTLPVEPSAGLREFSISLPDKADLERVTQQTEAAGVSVNRGENTSTVFDPFQNQITLIVQDQLTRS